MSWNLLDNITDTGNPQTDFVNLLAMPSNSMPIFWALIILIPFFLIITTRTFFSEVNRTGKGDILSSLAVGSFSTSLVAVALNLFGLISRITLSWTIGVSGFLIVLYFLLKD